MWTALLLLGLSSTGCAALGLSQPAPDARPPVPARAAYVADDGQVYVVALAGGDGRRVSRIAGQVAGEVTTGWEAAFGRWPTWAPDGSRLAFVRLLLGADDALIVAQLWTVAPDGSDLRKVWEATDRDPIYLAWAPNSTLIAMLVQDATDAALILVDTTGSQPPRQLARGNPCYFTWSSDSRALLLHLGGMETGQSPPALGILRLGPPDEFRSLGIVPGRFRTPGWSADGRKIAFVADGPDGVPAISLVSPEGGDITRLASSREPMAFAMTADGARLAWSSRTAADPQVFDGLEVVSTDGKQRTRLTDEPVLAFFWSPDARRLAFVTEQAGGPAVAWNVADADGANVRRLGAVTPTVDQMRLLTFFDQYAISHGPWWPDGSALAYAVGQPGAPRVLDGRDPGTIVTLPADGTAPARTLGGGSFVALPVPAP